MPPRVCRFLRANRRRQFPRGRGRGAKLEAFLKGKDDISDELVFPSPDGTILDPDNLYPRYFQAVLAKAGLRKIRLHDLRHSFGSLLIQSGASIVYVKEQMGHSTIQVTVDIYGHLIPGANVSFVDRLDEVPKQEEKTTPQQNAIQAQLPPELPREAETAIPTERADSIGAGRGNRTPTVLSDLRILSPLRLPISPSRLAFILAQGRRQRVFRLSTLCHSESG